MIGKVERIICYKKKIKWVMKIYEGKFCLDEYKLLINLYYFLGIMFLKIFYNFL